MNNRKRIVGLTTFCVLSIACVTTLGALIKTDFSGTWMMDKGRSYGIPQNIEQTMTVIQKGDRIDLETKIVTPQGERLISDTYILDGTETEFTPQGLQGPAPGKGKRKAMWLPDESGIVINEETIVDTPQGKATTQLTRKWRILADGALTIDLYHDTPNGQFETKRTFVRKQQ